MLTQPTTQHIELWPIDRLVEYPRNPRKNDAVADYGAQSKLLYISRTLLKPVFWLQFATI
jgi:hypothetical protein